MNSSGSSSSSAGGLKSSGSSSSTSSSSCSSFSDSEPESSRSLKASLKLYDTRFEEVRRPLSVNSVNASVPMGF